MKWVALNRESVTRIPFSIFVPEGASVGVAVRVVGRGAKELLIELGGGEVAQGVVKCEIDNLRLLVALVQFLLVKLRLVAAAEAVRQVALGYFTFCSWASIDLGMDLPNQSCNKEN